MKGKWYLILIKENKKRSSKLIFKINLEKSKKAEGDLEEIID